MDVSLVLLFLLSLWLLSLRIHETPNGGSGAGGAQCGETMPVVQNKTKKGGQIGGKAAIFLAPQKYIQPGQ